MSKLVSYTDTTESVRNLYYLTKVLKTTYDSDRTSDTDEDPFEVLDHVLGLGTIVAYVRGKLTEHRSYTTRPLILQGPSLARLYAQATTKCPGVNDERVAYDLVTPGNPLVVVECYSDRLNSLPKRFVKIEPYKIAVIDLAFGRVRRYSGDLGIWIAGYQHANYAKIRNVRLCLARLHAEQEVLQAALLKLSSGAIVHKRGEQYSEALEDYLNRATRVVNRKSWDGIQQSAIREAFEAAESTQNWQRTIYLRDKLAGARKQIVRKVEEFERSIQKRNVTNLYTVETMVTDHRTINIGAGTMVNAPVVMADKIENSFNTLANSDTDAELKELMGKLLKQVVAAGSALPPESAEELARDAETLTKEVSSKTPRRKWYEFSLNNIKEAAERVGDVGEPILETASKLLPLLISLFP